MTARVWTPPLSVEISERISENTQAIDLGYHITPSLAEALFFVRINRAAQRRALEQLRSGSSY